jgi:hypothetical protein
VGGALVVVVVMRVVADHGIGLPSPARNAHADGHATSASSDKDDHDAHDDQDSASAHSW